jgi:hypothetical protein
MQSGIKCCFNLNFVPEEIIQARTAFFKLRRQSMSKAGAVPQKGIAVEALMNQSGHKHRCLAWAGQYADGWEILAYYQEGSWEACFFKWDFHHEHVSGSSFEDVRSTAEQRIDFIENERLASLQPPSLSRKRKPLVLPVAGVEFPGISNLAGNLTCAKPLVADQSKAASRLAQP